MTNCINSLIRNAIIDKNDIKNILIAPYDGIFELELCQNTPHNYYQLSQLKQLIQPSVEHKRLHNLSTDINTWPLDLDIDLVICNNIVSQIDACHQLSQILQVPLIIVHHTIAPPFIKKEDMHIVLENYKYAKRIVILPLINKSWYANFDNISYGIKPINDIKHENQILIAGHFDTNSINIVNIIKEKSNIPVTILGNAVNTELTFDILLKHITTHKVFINLFNNSDINHMMLYAMAAGCTVITAPSPLNDFLIQDGYNGYKADSVEKIIQLSNKTIISTMGSNAQKTIATHFDITDFANKWNNLINTYTHKAFRL